MTRQEILHTALAQSALESGCSPADFLGDTPRVVRSRPHPAARRYLELPFLCDLTGYGNAVVASVAPGLEAAVGNYLARYRPEHCFETPNLHVLSALLRPHGADICFMAEYFLPDPAALRPRPLPSGYTLRLLDAAALAALPPDPWPNALTRSPARPDVLGLGAFEGDTLHALAACSADCDTMWQIGVDVHPAHRRRGLAAALTARLALAVLERGKVPFYCCAWSNLASARTAVAAGLFPAWVQVTAKPRDFIDRLNAEQAARLPD
ncbi:MAG: GNAT family N-acetyltransferase [Clostridia bacterium]|nr:GNAT family N-acetyltransferase [Clostridia bacterium]